MRHRKKNLTLAKTLSVHKLNCALQRKSQLIGSFASDKKSPKLCHRESSSRVLILPQELTFRILTGKQHYHHFQKFGTVKKKLTQNTCIPKDHCCCHHEKPQQVLTNHIQRKSTNNNRQFHLFHHEHHVAGLVFHQ